MVDSNNAINNTVGASISGVTNTLTVTNSSDTASSSARAKITVGGSSSGDPSLNFNVTGGNDFELGIDNTDSDTFKISASPSLGTTDTFIMTSTGERTMPLQPAFFAKASNVLNVTGDGTNFIIIFDSIIFEQGTNFNIGTGTFTAPIDGIYFFTSNILLSNIAVSHNAMNFNLFRNGSFDNGFDEFSPGAVRTAPNTCIVQGSCVLSLTAGDDINMNINVAGGTKTIATDGNFFGYLVC